MLIDRSHSILPFHIRLAKLRYYIPQKSVRDNFLDTGEGAGSDPARGMQDAPGPRQEGRLWWDPRILLKLSWLS